MYSMIIETIRQWDAIIQFIFFCIFVIVGSTAATVITDRFLHYLAVLVRGWPSNVLLEREIEKSEDIIEDGKDIDDNATNS